MVTYDSTHLFSREPRLYERVCPYVGPSVRRSVSPSVRRSVGNAFVGGQRRAGERLISCIRTCYDFTVFFMTFNSAHIL